MTIKEIAELTGKTRRTVERWITCDKVSHSICDKMSQAMMTKRPADFSLEETLEILNAGGVSKALMALLRENAARRYAPGGESTIFDVLRMVVNTLEAHEESIVALTGKAPRKAIADISQTPGRKNGENPLMTAIGKYVESSGLSYQEAWQMIFDKCYEQLRINFPRRAQNDGVTPADYIEREGFMPAVLSIAQDVFERPSSDSAFSERVEKSSQITARIIGGGLQ